MFVSSGTRFAGGLQFFGSLSGQNIEEELIGLLFFLFQFAGAHPHKAFEGFFPFANGVNAVAQKGVDAPDDQQDTSDDKWPGFIKCLLDGYVDAHFAGLV